MIKKIIAHTFCLLMAFLAFSLPLSANEPPDTIMIAGPSGSIASQNIAFWWTGKIRLSDSSDKLPSIKGFYYMLDGGNWTWTQSRNIAYYNLSAGGHQFAVKAVDSNSLEDPSPVIRSFSVLQSFETEPSEGTALFSISSDFEDDLNSKTISDELEQELRIKGLPISENAKVAGSDKKWLITDADKAYALNMSGTKIDIYGPINDSMNYALSLEPGRAIKCLSQSASGTDQDWFKVSLLDSKYATARQISIIFNRPDAKSSTSIRLYRSPQFADGEEIAKLSAKDRSYFATGIEPGIYYVHISPSDNEDPSAYYSLTVAVDSLSNETAWDKEHNDVSTTATESLPFASDFSPWMEIVGNKWGTNDSKDWYRIHISSSRRNRLSFDLTRPESGVITSRLYSASPVSLLGEFNVTPESGNQWKLELGSELGDYLVEVDMSKYDSSSPYFLTIRLSDFPKGETWEVEPNNSPDFADRLPIGTRIKASRGGSDDTDWFALNIPHDGILSLSASRILKSGSLNIRLLDGVGQLISEFSIQPNNQEGYINQNIMSGNYLVKADFSDFSGDYWITGILVKSVECIAENEILTKGNKLAVKLVWEKGNYSEFSILASGMSDIKNIMYDDGLHDDGIKDDGIYAGTYEIRDKDNAVDAEILVSIRDKSGNKAVIIAKEKISIDTLPPVISLVSHNAEKPLSVGQELIVTIKGEPDNEANFAVLETKASGSLIWKDKIPAYDDGKHDDGSADDGVYVGNYVILPDDYIYDATVGGYLSDEAGNTSSLNAVIKLDIAGERPVIISVIHDGRTTLGEDEVLKVDLVGDPEGIASFDIEGLITGVPLYDDGGHNDDARGDGKYSGSYKVKKGDGVISALLKAHLIDRKGRASSKTATVKVNIDAVVPASITDVKAYDRPDDQGGFITVSWKESLESDFANYNIYLSRNITIPEGSNKLSELEVYKVSNRSQTSLDIEIESLPASEDIFYVAVTATDIIGNESPLESGSIAGPVQPKDNLKPMPVRNVSGYDRKNDFGGIIILSWSEAGEKDFSRYNIYQDTASITATEALKPIDSITDRQLTLISIDVADNTDYYFAVTSVDLSGNESDLDILVGSVSGPIQAEKNIEEQDGIIRFLSAPVGVINYNLMAFHWNRFKRDDAKAFAGYYIRMDNEAWQWTANTSAAYYDLSPGSHKFSVRSSSGAVIERAFSILGSAESGGALLPVATSEQEPNDSLETASSIRTSVVVKGEIQDNDDWFRVHVPSNTSQCIMDILLSYTGISDSVMSVYSDKPFQKIAEASIKNGLPLHLALGVFPENDYLIQISSSPITYRLVTTINNLPKGYVIDSEPNDASTAANVIIADQSSSLEVAGNTHDTSKQDWFRLHITESEYYELSSDKLLMNIKMYSESCNMMIYSGSQGQMGEVTGNQQFTGLVESGKDYYIKVYSDDTKSGSYQFRVSIGKPTEIAYELEPNDLATLANPISIGEKKQGNNWDGSKDFDYYRLDIPKDGILSLQFSRPSGTGATTIEIYNAASSLVGSFGAEAGNSQKNSISIATKAGTYDIKIVPQNENPSAEYNIIALFVDSIKITYLDSNGKSIVERPLRVGDQIVVEMIANIAEAQFTIDNALTGEPIRVVPMPKENGKYKGIYTIAEDDDISESSISVLINDLSNSAKIKNAGRIGIVDNVPPLISELSHDGDFLSAGRKLTVRMIGSPRCIATFDIKGFMNGNIMNYHSDMYNMTANTADPPLAILNWDWKIDSGNTIVAYGKIKNLSDAGKSLVKIKAILYDASNEETGSKIAYASPDSLMPGVTATFKLLADYTGEKKIKLQLIYGTDEEIVGESADDNVVYTGIYSVSENDNITNAIIIGNLEDIAGNRSYLEAEKRVSFDNIPPVINSAKYNADKIFVEGDTLTVTAEGEPGNKADFDIGDFRTGLQMTESLDLPGTYIGSYLIRSGDQTSGSLIKVHLKDPAGNKVDFIGSQSITINTSAPVISSVTYNNIGRPFIANETLKVRAETGAGGIVTYDIVGLISNRPMYDDGKHDDDEAGDGIYTGSYLIKIGDNIRDAKISANVISPNGKRFQRFAIDTVSIDTTSPSKVDGVSVVDKPGDNGGYIVLSWKPGSEINQYRIYRSDQYITSTSNIEPIEIISDINTSSIELEAPISEFQKFYFAVTAVDIATNESPPSSVGPITSIDNLPPLPVSKVSANDRNFDNGKVIAISWSEPSIADDFARYNIYMSTTPIYVVEPTRVPASYTLVDSSISDRNVRVINISTSEDETDFYFAVTAVDTSGNESDISPDSIAGPIQSRDNIGATPDTIVQIISGPIGEIQSNDVTFIWRSGASLSGYYYRIDDDNWVWTGDNSKTYYNLKEGQHSFYVRADLGINNQDPLPAARVFSIRRVTISETEPNDDGYNADWVSKGMTIAGSSSDASVEDWYRFHVEYPGIMTLHFEQIIGSSNSDINIFRSLPPIDAVSIGNITISPVEKRASLTTGVKTGNYYIRIVSEGKYEFSVVVNEIPKLNDIVDWDRESNDVPANAQLLGYWDLNKSEVYGAEVSGTANMPEDIDWYRLQVSGVKSGITTFMNLDFIRAGAGGLTSVDMYQSFPANESSRIAFISYSPGTSASSLAVPIRTGDYFLRINNSAETELMSIYNLKISFTLKSEKWEQEPNNVSQFANPLSIGDRVTGTSWHPDEDVDWYKFRLEKLSALAAKQDIVLFSASHSTAIVSYIKPYGKGSTEMKLINADMSDIAVASASVLSGQKATISANLSIGDYYVSLHPSGETDPLSEYQMIINVLDIKAWILDASALAAKQDNVLSSASHNTMIPDMKAPISVDDTIKLLVKWEAAKTIRFDIGDLRKGLVMYDDGKHDDFEANDGIYAGSYTVQAGDVLNEGKIRIHIEPIPDSSVSWTADFDVQDPIAGAILLNIDTTAPKIFSADHDMPLKPLAAGKTLKVKVSGEAKAKEAFFDILNDRIYRSKIYLKEEPDGIYSGEYSVEDGDNIDNGVVVCHLKDEAGNESSTTIPRPISFDTIPPEIIEIGHTPKKALVEGDTLTITAITDTRNGKASFSIGELVKDKQMYDDGTSNGIYTGKYTVKKGDNVIDTMISVTVTDEAGNVSQLSSSEPITIDTAPPNIISFVHNAKKILTYGDKLVITLKGDLGNVAIFDIGEFRKGLPMYDDGTRGDEEASDGIYTGTYIVGKGDLSKDARITGYLTNKNGNRSINRIFETINIDAVPPTSITNVNAMDKPNDEGYWIILTWKPYENNPESGDFDHYNIYRESSPITSLTGLTPLVDDGTMRLDIWSTNRAEAVVPVNGADQYFAVAVVDTAGNESPIDTSTNGSTFGPASAIDNIAPDPVIMDSAYDKPYDQGKTIIVTWAKHIGSKDLDRYGIYVSREPITSLKDMDPIIIPAKDVMLFDKENKTQSTGVYISVSQDGVDFFFAVTAYDKSGNESSLDSEGKSSFGPVRSKDDVPPVPVLLISADDTPDDSGGFINIIWSLDVDEKIQNYNIYLSDNSINNENIEKLSPVASVDDFQIMEVSGMEAGKYKLNVKDGFFYVAVTAVDLGNNESALYESGESVFGPIQAVSNIVKANSDTRIVSGFDPNSYIIIPAGAMDNNETVQILLPDKVIMQKVDEANRLLEKSHIDPEIDSIFIDAICEVKSSSQKLKKPFVFNISYSTEDTDISQDTERYFRVFRLNESPRIPIWELVTGNQKVDTALNTISVQSSSFGVFRVARLKLPERLDKVIVYPNPFIPSRSINGYITFKNLTENVTIDIYTINGEHIRTIEKFGGGDEATWDVLNKRGNEIAAGTYVFAIQNDLETYVGKVIILR